MEPTGAPVLRGSRSLQQAEHKTVVVRAESQRESPAR